MTIYQHRQRGTLVVAVVSIILVVDLFLFLTIREEVFAAPLFGIVTILLLLLMWAFSSLTVEVTDSHLKWRFGPGLFSKSIARAEIVSAEPTRTKWWYGWGIRLTPRGWLYNVSGFGAVEITRHNGRVTLIGSDEPEKLAEVLRS